MRHVRHTQRRIIAMAIALLGAGGGATLWATHAAGDTALATIATHAAGQPASAAVDERAGRALFAGFDPAVSLVDTRTGRLVRAIRVGDAGRPHAVVMAARTGHAFVAGMGSQSVHGLPPVPSHLSMIDTHRGACSVYIDGLGHEGHEGHEVADGGCVSRCPRSAGPSRGRRG